MKIPKAKKLPSGKWRVQVVVNGRRLSVTAKTKTEAETEAAALKIGAVPAPAEVTLKDAIESHIANGAYSPSTVRGYNTIKRNYFPDIINRPVSSVKNWQAVITELSKRYAPKTVRNAWGLLQPVLAENGITPKIRLPKKPSQERPFLQPEQIPVFLDAIKGSDCEKAALFALHGLRRSEIYALDYKCVKNGYISVSRAIVPDEHNKMVMKDETKTLASTRTVPIMIPRLSELLANGGTGRICTEHPFTAWKHIKRICEANGLPVVGFHSLRHTFASLGYHLKLSELEMQKLGGWADPATMRKIYTHLADADRLRAENKITEFFTSKTGVSL